MSPLFSPSKAQLAQTRLETALDLLQALHSCLGINLSGYAGQLHHGQPAAEVFAEIGIALAKLLQENQRVIDHQKTRIEDLYQTVLDLRLEPIRSQLDQAMQANQVLEQRLAEREQTLADIQNQLKLVRRFQEQEKQSYEAVIASQNSIIAKQQLQLNWLLGGPLAQ